MEAAAIEATQEQRGMKPMLFRILRALREPLVVVLGVITVFWKLALTKQYTFLNNPDMAYMVTPRLEPVIYAIRHWSILLWTPYELFGQPTIGQVQPGVTSPFTFLLALAPLTADGQVQFFYIHIWFVLLHCLAGIFAWRFFRELGCSAWPAVIGGILFATMGYYGNTGWPNNLQPAIMAPLVFLFLLRSLRGRAPLKNAAWAGVMLGISWLCGHHDMPVMMTYAVGTIGLVVGLKSCNWRPALSRLAVFFVAMGLVAAVQLLPAIEYGKLSTRWTDTGPKTWKDKVPFQEHERVSLPPRELLHILLPGGGVNYSDPFVGVVGLSLAAIAVWSGFRRKEVRFFLFLAIGALLWAMAGVDVLYGPLYALGPLIEKSREPVVVVFLFDFAAAALAAIGAEILFSAPEPSRDRTIARSLLVLAGGIVIYYLLLSALKVEADQRPLMSVLIALLLAGVYQVWTRNGIRRGWALALVGVLVVVEQGTEVSLGWARVHDPAQMAILSGLTDTRDLKDWLRLQPDPKRIHKNEDDVRFNFGDWYRFDSAYAYGASMLTATNELGGWWSERIGRMYGLNYTLSRKQPREGLQDVFTGKTGIKIWYDPGAFPRAWTVHQIIVAPNDWNGANMINTWTFDLRTIALTVQSRPALDTCPAGDRVTSIIDKPESLQVSVEMACKGLLVVSDNWFPGWHAAVDGQSAEIWKVNTAIRGVVVPAGRHTVTMNYHPFSVYFGFLCTLFGLAGAIVLQRRRESDGPDIL